MNIELYEIRQYEVSSLQLTSVCLESNRGEYRPLDKWYVR